MIMNMFAWHTNQLWYQNSIEIYFYLIIATTAHLYGDIDISFELLTALVQVNSYN